MFLFNALHGDLIINTASDSPDDSALRKQLALI